MVICVIHTHFALATQPSHMLRFIVVVLLIHHGSMHRSVPTEALHASEALLRENDTSQQTTPSPVCQFFKSGRGNPKDSASWGKYDLCDMTEADVWIRHLVRHILLYRYGGLWIDTDVLLLRDVYPVTIQIGYQFVMRWVNNHVYYLKAKSPVGLRILHTVLALPYEDSDLWRTRVLDRMCRPYGYKPVTDHVKFRDVYNVCVLKRVLAAEDNKQGDLDNVLFDYPLGWWDQHWLSVTLRAQNLRHLKFFATPNPSCPNIDKKMGAKSYVSSIQSALALHTRYPGHKGHNPKGLRIPTQKEGATLSQGSTLAGTILAGVHPCRGGDEEHPQCQT
ncbi:hypothetical protein WJX79_009202 [Trebouxia sp. C0005]